MKPKIIAVDFDGTLCENAWPEIGAPRYDIIEQILAAQSGGAKLILWTCREGNPLADAIQWCRDHGIYFDAINQNLPEMIALYGNDCRKIGADLYLDDRAIPV